VSCDPASGNCVEGDLKVCPPDNNLCAPEACNPSNGNCEAGAPITCAGGNLCASEVCNPDTGQCEIQAGGGLALLVRVNGKLGNQSQLLASVGANNPGGTFHLGKNVFAADGTSVNGDRVHVGKGSSLFDVNANSVFSSNLVVRGQKQSVTLPLTTPFCPIAALSCDASNPIMIPPGAPPVAVLAPGNYGKLTLRSGQTVNLNGPGVFNFCGVQTTRNGRIVVAGATDTTINIHGDLFRLANGSFLGRNTPGPLPIVNFDGSSMRVGAQAEITAFVSAPNATLRMGRSAKLQGSFCVENTRSDKGVVIECPPAPPTSTTSTTPTPTTPTTTIPGVAVCGDGVASGGEQCDPPCGTGQCGDGSICNSTCQCEVAAACACGASTPTSLTFITSAPGGTPSGSIAPAKCVGGNTPGGDCVTDGDCLGGGTCRGALKRGGLYFGGGVVGVPLPATIPDNGKSIMKACCNGSSLSLASTTAADTGSSNTCTALGCNFGPPLPIPNPANPGLSTCVLNQVARNAVGSADCSTGAAAVNLPLGSHIVLGGDMLPKRCAGTTDPNNVGRNCVSNTDCPGGTCALDSTNVQA